MEALFKVASDKDVLRAKEDLIKELKEVGFGVLWELSFKDKLREKGQDFDKEFFVLETCNPPLASEVLKINIEVGNFLPCKVVVYEGEEATYFSMMKPSLMVSLLDEPGIKEHAETVERRIRDAMDKAK